MSLHCKKCGGLIVDPDTNQFWGEEQPDGTWICGECLGVEEDTPELSPPPIRVKPAIYEPLKRATPEQLLSAAIWHWANGNYGDPDLIRRMLVLGSILAGKDGWRHIAPYWLERTQNEEVCIMESTFVPGVISSDLPFDFTHHRRTDKICPLRPGCKNQAWEHIPHLEGVTWENYDNPMLACWSCFHWLWQGAGT